MSREYTKKGVAVMKNNKKKTNSSSIIISAVIIAIAVLLIEMLGSFLFENIELPKSVMYLMKPIMYVITIAFTQYVIQKVSEKSKKNNK